VYDMAEKHPGETLAAFSHGMAIRLFLAKVEGYCLAEFYKTQNGDNTAVSLIEVEGSEIRIVFRDDNSHLLEEEDLSVFGKQIWWKDNNRGGEPGYWFRPFDGEKDQELLRLFAEETGAGKAFLDELCCAAKAGDGAVQTVMEEDSAAGLVFFDTEFCADGCAAVKAIYTLPACRSRGYGIQLMGQAVQFFRPMGAERIGLSCPVGNEKALRFFRNCGMKETARDEKTVQMEMDIGFGEHTRCPLKMIEDRL